ncbi:MAG: DUF6206 family protein [Anaerolineae bacterium]|jgi:hypothetical protein|nr:DUF6206 family protein [Anaerolineae bacterium]MDH7473238.1 DUF6206 family protein [Anaerolineae bacterium]
MPEVKINAQLLREFEKGLNPRFPERSQVPARVLDYGEISTVLEIGVESEKGLAYKRLPMFRNEEEARSYQALYDEYVNVLQNRIGLRVVPGDTIRLADRGRFVVYIVQEKLPREAIGHRAIHCLSPAEVTRLVLAVLRETGKVFDFNQQHKGELEIGFDGQISNWVIVGFDPAAPRLSEEIRLMYFDTSTPLLRKNGEEQLDPELFLRSAPSFLVWIIRLLFLQDVMTRYYDFRQVMVDLVANFYKEQRPDLIPGVVDTVNEFCAAGMQASGFKPITMEEVRAYYREDAWIWRTYLAFRKIDRSLHRLLGREYPYILPEKIQR